MAERKVALITASSAGLGATTAILFAASGYDVVINYRSSKERAEKILQDIINQHVEENSTTNGVDVKISSQPWLPRCIAIQADMSRRQDIDRLVTSTIEAMGRLDVVVSNHGWTRIRRFDDLNDNVDEDDWDACFNMNVKTHLYLFHSSRAHLEATNGSFISVASVAGIIPSGSSIPYSVTKAAHLHLMKTLAQIASPQVRVNSVSPGLMMTDWGKQFPEEKIRAAEEKSTLKRLAKVEDVALQILSFARSRSQTGCNMVIDAGWSLG